jgi:hypothetical protein
LRHDRSRRNKRGWRLRPGDYDQLWCVFDTEAPTDAERVRAASEHARGKAVKLAGSNPAFEFWLLLHFVYTTRPFENAEAVVDELRKHLPNYQKNMNVYPIIRASTEEAIVHAEQVLDDHKQTTDHPLPNPSTRVHELVRELLRLGQ